MIKGVPHTLDTMQWQGFSGSQYPTTPGKKINIDIDISTS